MRTFYSPSDANYVADCTTAQRLATQYDEAVTLHAHPSIEKLGAATRLLPCNPRCHTFWPLEQAKPADE